MKTGSLHGALVGIALSFATVPAAVLADDAACLKCHAKGMQGKSLHAPMAGKCAECHGEVDASQTPHKSMGKFPSGLVTDVPALCHKCHDKKEYEGTSVHGPVGTGQCTICHAAHASENATLLTREGSALCLDCHEDVTKKPHVIAGFSRAGHPLGNEKTREPVADPLRGGKRFYCGSCHEPHKSAFRSLLRIDPGSQMEFCMKCHPK